MQAPVATQRGIEHLYKYLSTVLERGALRNFPELAETVRVALISSDLDLVSDVCELVRIQELDSSEQEEEPAAEQPLFCEPSEEQLRGAVFIGNSVPNGHRAFLKLRSFGQPGHVAVYGATGKGKSWLLHLIAAQVMTILGDITVIIHDTTNQAAPVLVPLVPPERLNVLDYPNYRSNPFLGRAGIPQLDYLRMASDQLMDSFSLTPVGMNYLMHICESIVSEGRIASVPSVLERAQQPKSRSQSARALQNRLLPLVMKGDRVFTCERGIDLDKLLSRSCVLNLKDVPSSTRRLLFNAQYFWLTHTRPALTTWQLKTVFIIHEAREILSHASEFFLNMVSQARNYGIGFVFANQTSQVEDATVRSNIGTKLIFRLEDSSSLEGSRVGMNLKEEQRNFILNMPPRTMLVRRPDIPYPFLVKVPELV